MRRRSSKPPLRALTALAASQGGYFTARQARTYGYLAPHLSYHASVGNFERAGHGVYRIATLPVAEHDDLIRLWLWSRGRDDRPQATCSHQTALDLHGLSEAIPDSIHLTVPPGFRKAAPRGCVLHPGAVGRGERQSFDAVPATSPLRTLSDLARDAAFPNEQFERAARLAHRRGLIDSAALRRLLGARRSTVTAVPAARANDVPRRARAPRQSRT